ncbi:MAG: Clp protease/crotonase-like domain-containing protein, partial [Planctomycetota bacterium]
MSSILGVVKAVILGVAAVLMSPGVRADVVQMTDGRRFEGEILGEDVEAVTIDTKLTPTIRTTVRLDRSEVESIERKPLPQGFFDPPPPPPQASDPMAHSPQDTLYLEVPIEGVFGKDIYADGVNAALRYAGRYRIHHVVFVVNSPGGDLDESRATYDLLRRNQRQFTFHAIVRECIDGALGVAVWCDSIHILPGARLGGGSSGSGRGDEDRLLRSQVAREIIRQARLEGPVADIVGAMIDPDRTLAAWRDEAGEIVVGAAAPPAVPAARQVFRVGPGELLVLDHEQAVGLGLEPLVGGAAELGGVVGLSGWKAESDYGRRVMAETAGRKRREAEEASAKFAAAVEDNVRRREALEQYLQECLQRAAEWNPSDASYD